MDTATTTSLPSFFQALTAEDRRHHFELMDRVDFREWAEEACYNELMEGKCDPLLPFNLGEALAEFQDVDVLSELLRGKNYDEAGRLLLRRVTSYWHHMAKSIAEHRIREQMSKCHHCFGRGCRWCSDD